MSDFDNFESAAPGEEDPAAEFLAREQDQLAGLEDDGFMPGQTQGSSDFGMPDSSGTDMFDPMRTEGDNVEATPDDQFAAMTMNEGGAPSDPFGAENLDTEVASAPEPNYMLGMDDVDAQDAGFDPFAGGMTDDQPSTGDAGGDAYSGYSAISQADKQRQEPEKIRLWREEQKTMLEEKDVESEKRKAEWREVAKKELEEWYKHRAEQFEKTKVNNREHEAAIIQERDESVPGHEWERICRLCEFNPKHSGNKKDVSRQRSILLQLKQAPLVR